MECGALATSQYSFVATRLGLACTLRGKGCLKGVDCPALTDVRLGVCGRFKRTMHDQQYFVCQLSISAKLNKRNVYATS